MMQLPSKVHPSLAEAAVDAFFADDGWRRQASRLGWDVVRHDTLTVLATLRARPIRGEAETFVIRLECDYYPSHPPDVRFINPDTLEYDPAHDLQHLPVLGAPYCAVHPSYGYSTPYPYGPQLVCSSMTLGYYISGHTPTPDQRWQPGRDTLVASIAVVHRALQSEHYTGRQPRA